MYRAIQKKEAKESQEPNNFRSKLDGTFLNLKGEIEVTLGEAVLEKINHTV
jgi:hypothetical protein